MLQAPVRQDVKVAQPRRDLLAVVRRVPHVWRYSALVCLLALVLDLHNLGGPSLWMDESFSVQLARQPLSVIWGAFHGGEPNMIAYHVLLHFWLKGLALAGLSATEFLVRLPSAVFAALSSVVVYLLGRRFAGHVAGLVGALLYLINPLQLTYAQQARSYGMQLLVVCLSWYLLLTVLTATTNRGRLWVAWALVSAFSVYVHAFSLLILLAEYVAFALLCVVNTEWRARVRQNLGYIAAATVAVGILIAPMIQVSRSGGKTGWLPSPDILNVLQHAGSALLGKSGPVAFALILAAIALVALAVVVVILLPRLPWTAHRIERPRAWLRRQMAANAPAHTLRPLLITLLCWFVVPIVVSFEVSQGSTRLFSSRYLVVVVPAACLLLGLGVMALRWRPLVIASSVALIGVALSLVPGYYAHAQVEDWRTPTRWLANAYQPGDGLVSYNNVQGAELPVAYYLWLDGSPATFTADSPGAIQLDRFGSGDPFQTYQEALDPQALAAFAAHHSRIFFIAGRFADATDAARAQAAQTWLDAHYTFVAQTSSSIVTIRLYQTSPS